MKKIKIIVLIVVAFVSLSAMATTKQNQTHEQIASIVIPQQNGVDEFQSSLQVENLMLANLSIATQFKTEGGFLDFLKKLITMFQNATTTYSDNTKVAQRGPRIVVGSCVSGCQDEL